MVFTISGIVNPERRKLRDKACAMGARYRPQWTKDCTHLVGVFVDAPKHREMKGNADTQDHA